MLECIKQELLKARANIEALKQSEIANQKAKANIEVIDPECQRLEEEKTRYLPPRTRRTTNRPKR